MTAQAINHPEIKMTWQAAILDLVEMSQLRFWPLLAYVNYKGKLFNEKGRIYDT